MLPINDYHMHTKLCGHADGNPFEYVEQAIKVGLKEIGFSDHAPFFSHRDSGVTMDHSELPEYHRMIEEVREKYKDQIDVKVAIEADYMPGYVEKVGELLSKYPYQYVIGSVHFIQEWGFDNPEERPKWGDQDVNEIYRIYHKLLREAAQTGIFDIMGHVDLVKKFGDKPTDDISDVIRETAKIFKSSRVAVEINSSGLRKPIGEIYPAIEDLSIYCEEGVPIVFGSDSHTPLDVGKDFDKSVEHAKASGYKEYITFKDRKIDQILSL